tara:strand:- start:2916 stop:4808 length:1893 start_codon:yes stop_codon:yes gene_type:complete
MISTTLDPNSGRVLVVHSDSAQPYAVCVKDAADWTEIHNYIINENNIDDIPNRKIDCTSEMQCSPKRGVYEMSPAEAEVLRKHSKIEWVEKSGLYNEYELEQRKYDEEFDKYTDTDRFKYDVVNTRYSYNANNGTTLDFTQWGLYRHSHRNNKFGYSSTVDDELHYTLTGKNVDVVVMDTGILWTHPEFLKPGVEYTDIPVETIQNCEQYTRVRDILIHGETEYGINWSNEGLVAPGTGSLSNYNRAGALLMHSNGNLNNSIQNMHGSHCAGTAAGNQFGHAFEANIWTIACIDRSDLGWSNPCDGFDYIKVWHKNKPINPLTGRRNPTVVNGSWGFRQFYRNDQSYTVNFRGTSYSDSQITSTVAPAIYYQSTLLGYYNQFTSREPTGQSEADEVFDDPDCKDIVFCFSAGNSADKQDYKEGEDYNNEVTSGNFYYSGTRSKDPYYNRSGTPAISAQGREDAAIVIGSIDSTRQTTNGQERTSSFSNRGPAITVWAAGHYIISPYSEGYADPRSGAGFLIAAISGTSMATPQVVGVMALYLESQPDATRAEARNWLLTHGSTDVPDSDATSETAGFYDPYQSNSATDSNYWGNTYSLKSSTRRILYNPFANNGKPSMVGVTISGASFSQ